MFKPFHLSNNLNQIGMRKTGNVSEIAKQKTRSTTRTYRTQTFPDFSVNPPVNCIQSSP